LLSATAAILLALDTGWVFMHFSSPADTRKTTSSKQIETQPDNGARAAVGFRMKYGTTKWGYIDTKGNVVIQPICYSYCPDFSEGMVPAQYSGKWGYLNDMGQIVIGPQFDNASPFREYRAAVCMGGKQITIDHAPIYIGGKCGYIDHRGELAIPLRFDDTLDFSEGLAAVGIGSKYGYIDITGKLVIFPQFDEANPFSDQMAAVKMGDKWGYIDHTGNIAISPRYPYPPEKFFDGRALIQPNPRIEKYGYIDKTGRMVIPARFTNAFSFSEGLAAVLLCPRSGCAYHDNADLIGDGRWGYVNTEGKFAIPPKFENAHSFSEGLAAVDNQDYIDKTGKVVIHTNYFTNGSFSQGLGSVGIIYGQYGYINKTGALVVIVPNLVNKIANFHR